MGFLIAQSIVALLILIAGYIITISPESNPYMIFIMGLIAGTWLTELIEDLKKWRKMKK